MAIKKRSSLKSSTQTQAGEEKMFPGILNYTAAASCILHLGTGREAHLSLKDRTPLKSDHKFFFAFPASFLSFSLLPRLLIRDAAAELAFPLDFLCNFAASQVRNLSWRVFAFIISVNLDRLVIFLCVF